MTSADEKLFRAIRRAALALEFRVELEEKTIVGKYTEPYVRILVPGGGLAAVIELGGYGRGRIAWTAKPYAKAIALLAEKVRS